MSSPLDRTTHRPWPLPRRAMDYGAILARPVVRSLADRSSPDAPMRALMRPYIPAALQIDTFDGQAWIAVVPFRMSGVRLRATPALPWLSAFPELNVRTYVVADRKPGVWFFSLDARNPAAVAIARAWFHLPYFRARMKCEDRERMDPLLQRAHPSRRQSRRVKSKLSSGSRSFRGQTGNPRAFPDRALLPLQRRPTRPPLPRRNPSPTLAIANCRSKLPAKLHDRSRRNCTPIAKAATTFRPPSGRRSLAPAAHQLRMRLLCRRWALARPAIAASRDPRCSLLTTCEKQKTPPKPCNQTPPRSSIATSLPDTAPRKLKKPST